MAGNPFLNRAAQRGIGGAGRESEKRTVKSMGARPTPASGALDAFKGDAVLGDFRLELKSSTTNTLRLDIGWLTKISHEAVRSGQTPALVFSFVTEAGKPVMDLNSEWVAIPKKKFMELLGD